MTTPASRIKSRYWFVRVDGVEEYLRQKCGELSRCLDVKLMLSAYHTGKTKENPHCHFVIEISSEVQKQSFAVRIKSLFGIEKKSQYAIDVWDSKRDVGAVSYLYHEDDAKIITNVGFTDEELICAQQANAAVQAVVAVNAERASGKLVNRALEKFGTEKHVMRKDILLFMLQEIQAGTAYHPGQYRLKQMVEEVEIKRANPDELEEMAELWEKNLWKEY